ncbi:Bug family tripartite tricarboxylate transporter substrate binding protein, partial [Klebsiella pneumoniae]|uniref:Bug family tripartite tricarboxylate transporter substrate binding protein n=1 Tax=Klebsiella pneumoniae TaxID=573 RepID=UPI00222FC6D6
MADKIGAALGQTVIVENKAGAGGSIGSAAVSAATPDGYTLLMGNNASTVIYSVMSKAPRYNALRDFTPIAQLARSDQYIGVNA